MEALDVAVRDYLGWDYVLRNAAELDLTHNQKLQAEEKRRLADQTARERLRLTYAWVLVPTQDDGGRPFTIEAMRADGGADKSMARHVSEKLGTQDLLRTRQVASAVRMQLGMYPTVWEAGHVRAGALWELYARYCYMPRLRDIHVLLDGLTEVTELTRRDSAFALAHGVDDDGRYEGLWLPTDDGPQPVVSASTLIVKPTLAERQREKEFRATAETSRGDEPTKVAPASGDSGSSEHPSQPAPKPRKTRLFAATQIDAESTPAAVIQINNEILKHLIGDTATQVRVRLEIEAERPAGFDDALVRTVGENATTLRFDDVSFEE